VYPSPFKRGIAPDFGIGGFPTCPGFNIVFFVSSPVPGVGFPGPTGFASIGFIRGGVGLATGESSGFNGLNLGVFLGTGFGVGEDFGFTGFLTVPGFGEDFGFALGLGESVGEDSGVKNFLLPWARRIAEFDDREELYAQSLSLKIQRSRKLSVPVYEDAETTPAIITTATNIMDANIVNFFIVILRKGHCPGAI